MHGNFNDSASGGCVLQELVLAGPDGIHDVVKRVIRDGEAEALGGQAPPGSHPEAVQAVQHSRSHDGESSLHNLAPVGARGSSAATISRTGMLLLRASC
jgi:hypothetical protein